jgi:hypothetical protein
LIQKSLFSATLLANPNLMTVACTNKMTIKELAPGTSGHVLLLNS